MKTLCPACGTTNTSAHPFARCINCKKRLPLTVPRKLAYTARSFAKPLIVVFFLALALIVAPAYKAYRDSLRVNTSTTY